MENRAHALVAGLFVIFLCVATIAVAMWFGGDSVLRNSYLVVSRESVTGLNSQAAVHYRGVNIGTVERIYFDPENSHQILIDISVDQNIILGQNVFAQLTYQGVTGLAFIQLNDDGTDSEPLQSDARIPMHRSLLDEITGSGKDLLTNINALVNQAHLVFSEPNRTQISQVIKKLESSIGHFENIISQSQHGIEAFSGFATDIKSILIHFDQLLIETHQAMIKVNQQGGMIDSLSQSAEQLTDTIPKLGKVSDGIARSTRNMDRVLQQLERNPQSLLFGAPSSLPDPGEEGFMPPGEKEE
jgi:phospholipid/cholesterol/gamma-HCH transport system substrate-binding protein